MRFHPGFQRFLLNKNTVFKASRSQTAVILTHNPIVNERHSRNAVRLKKASEPKPLGNSAKVCDEPFGLNDLSTIAAKEKRFCFSGTIDPPAFASV